MQRIALPLLGLDMHLAAGHKYRVKHDRGGGHVALVDLDRLAVAALELALEFRDDYGMRAGLHKRILDALKLVDVDAVRRQDGDFSARDGVGFCVVFDADIGRRLLTFLPANFLGASTPMPSAARTARSWSIWLKMSWTMRWRISLLSTLPSSKCVASMSRSCSPSVNPFQDIVAWLK